MRLVCTSTHTRTRRALPHSSRAAVHRAPERLAARFRRLRRLALHKEAASSPTSTRSTLYQGVLLRLSLGCARAHARRPGHRPRLRAQDSADGGARPGRSRPPHFEAAQYLRPTVDVSVGDLLGAARCAIPTSAWASPTAPASSARAPARQRQRRLQTTSTATSRRPSSPAPSSRRPPGSPRR